MTSRRVLPILALFALTSPVLFAHSSPGHSAVFGSDERVLLPSNLKSLQSKIGLLYEPRSKSICTAFCVDERTVVTAAHCLYRTRGERALPLSRMTFRLPGAPLAPQSRIAGASRAQADSFVMAGSVSLSIRPPIEATKDWALVRLQAPVCKSGGLRLSRRQPAALVATANAVSVYQVGFHGDFGKWRLTLSPPCTVGRSAGTADSKTIAQDFSDPATLLLHTCDTGGASSGSPLLVDGNDGPEVVGLNVGTYLQSRIRTEAGTVVHRFRATKIANTAVSALAFADPADVFRRARIVVNKDGLLRIQTALEAAGFYGGARDGRFGPRLRDAIEAFERSERRVPTGLASEDLLRRLTLLAITRPSVSTTNKSAEPSHATGGEEQPSSGRHSGRSGL